MRDLVAYLKYTGQDMFQYGCGFRYRYGMAARFPYREDCEHHWPVNAGEYPWVTREFAKAGISYSGIIWGGAVPEATGFVKYRSREDAKALSESYVAALPERDYEGAVFFVTTPDRSFLSPEDTETVLSRLALQRNEEIAERFNVTLLTSGDTYLEPDMVQVTTESADAESAVLSVRTTVINESRRRG